MQYRKIAYYSALLTGLLMVFIGGRFLLSPLVAEAGFGIHVPVGNNFSFHYIKGIRDLFSGLIILLLLFTKEFRALGILLLVAIIIPSTDLTIVWSDPNHISASLYPHIIAILLLLVLGIYYIKNNTKIQRDY